MKLAPRIRRQTVLGVASAALAILGAIPSLRAAVIWTEGEKPAHADVKRHPWWYDKVNKNQLSGGDFISNWGDKPGEIEYAVTAPNTGEYDFWVRANPVGTKLSYQINGGVPAEIDLGKDQRENVNIAEDGKPDLRFLAWEHVGKVTLKQGANAVAFSHAQRQQQSRHARLLCAGQ